MAQNDIPYSPTPSVVPTIDGSGARYQDVPQASPAAFGAQIGEAESKLGATSEDLGKMYMQRANEASANDKIVNQWAPTVTKLSSDYYSKQGKDAVAGFQPYMDGLQQQRSSLLENATPAEAQILNQYMTRHIAQEYDGAMRHQVQQMDVYENQMSDAFVQTQTTNAVNAGSNPSMINTALQSGSARIQMHGLDRGQSPDQIQQQQNDFVGKTTQAVVSSALTRGDVGFANSFYANNKDTIPGAQQIEIDRTLHAENMRYTGNDNANAIINGQPLPHPPNGGVQATDVRSTVAGAAQSSGVDPNASLMIAGIESSFGQNVGTRGDVGQTGKPAASLNEQAQNLVTAQKQAQDAADKAVGGTAAPWQMYTVYQQGAGGGVALLKPENANAKAVDVVSPFYKNPKDALAAIQNNGGNATMTASQFTDMLHQKCDTVYGQVKCDTTTPNGQSVDLSKAIVDPHQTGGITLQPAATPVKALQAFDAQYPAMLQRAQEIPNLDQRSATLEALEKKHSIYQGAANAYTSVLTNQATQLMANPKFSMDQVTPEMYSALASDHPQTLIAMQNRAKENLENNGVGKEAMENGPAFHQLNIGTQQGAEAPTTPELINKAYNDGQITSKAQDYLLSKTVGKKSLTPDEQNYKNNALEYAKAELGFTGVNSMPESIAAYSKFSIALDNYLNDPKTREKPATDIYNLGEGSAIDKLVKSFEPGYGDLLPKPSEKPGFIKSLFSPSPATPAFPRQEDLKPDQIYNSPKYGPVKWTGTGFVKAEQPQAGQ